MFFCWSPSSYVAPPPLVEDKKKGQTLHPDLISYISTFLTISEKAHLIAPLNKTCYQVINHISKEGTTPLKIRQSIDRFNKILLNKWSKSKDFSSDESEKRYTYPLIITKYSIQNIKDKTTIAQKQIEWIINADENLLGLRSNEKRTVQKIYEAHFNIFESGIVSTSFDVDEKFFYPDKIDIQIDIKCFPIPDQDKILLNNVTRFIKIELNRGWSQHREECIIL